MKKIKLTLFSFNLLFLFKRRKANRDLEMESIILRARFKNIESRNKESYYYLLASASLAFLIIGPFGLELIDQIENKDRFFLAIVQILLGFSVTSSLAYMHFTNLENEKIITFCDIYDNHFSENEDLTNRSVPKNLIWAFKWVRIAEVLSMISYTFTIGLITGSFIGLIVLISTI